MQQSFLYSLFWLDFAFTFPALISGLNLQPTKGKLAWISTPKRKPGSVRGRQKVLRTLTLQQEARTGPVWMLKVPPDGMKVKTEKNLFYGNKLTLKTTVVAGMKDCKQQPQALRRVTVVGGTQKIPYLPTGNQGTVQRCCPNQKTAPKMVGRQDRWPSCRTVVKEKRRILKLTPSILRILKLTLSVLSPR